MVKYIEKICLIFLVILVCFCFNNSCIVIATTTADKLIEEYTRNPNIIKTLDKNEVTEWITRLKDYDRSLGVDPIGAGPQAKKTQVQNILAKLYDRRTQLNQQQIENSGGYGGGGRPIHTTSGDVNPKTTDETMQGASDWINNADTTGTFNEQVLKSNIGYIYNIFFACGMVIAVGCGVVLGIKFMTSSVEGQAKVKQLLLPYGVGCVIIFGAFGIWKIVINFMEMFN